MLLRVSRRDEDGSTLSAYLRGIAKLPRLTPDEERSLGGAAGDGTRDVVDMIAQDLVTVEQALIDQSALDDLAEALRELSRKEFEVMRLRFGLEDDEPCTLQEIGDKLHLSRERVRQIESRAKDKLRRSVKLRSRLN